LKPSITNQAIGISLVTNVNQLRSVLYNADPIQQAGDFVLQTYLPPLLLDGRKFHLRVFMILVGNITAYVDPHFLAIFSLRQYNGAGLDDTRAHLTNIAHQDVQSIEDQHRCMRLFDETTQDMVDASLVSSIGEANSRISDIRQRVYEIVSETVEAVTSELTFSSKNNCFEIFGLDFMIDKEWNTWLLEANAEPDLSKAGDRLQHVIDRMLLNTLSVVMSDNDWRFSYDNSSRKENHLVKVYDRRGRSF
jgi:tubulin--tyrosine ligase